MRFYKNQHQFYIGIDLHARTMYICVINNIGETVFHKNMEWGCLESSTNKLQTVFFRTEQNDLAGFYSVEHKILLQLADQTAAQWKDY